MHPIRQPADVQPAPGEVGLGLVEEAVGVADMPGDAAKLLQLFERQPPRPVEHVLFIEEVFVVFEVVAHVAEQRYGLIADLARAQCGRDLGQRLQLLADTEAVRRRAHRHATAEADPGRRAHVAADEVVTRPLSLTHLSGELTLERVDNASQGFGIYPALLASLKLAHRRLQSREGCSPFPQHARSIPNKCLGVNTLTRDRRKKAGPHPAADAADLPQTGEVVRLKHAFGLRTRPDTLLPVPSSSP